MPEFLNTKIATYNPANNEYEFWGEHFRIKRTYGDKVWCECKFKTCKAVIVIKVTCSTVIRNTDHTHTPVEIIKKGVKMEIKRFYASVKNTSGNAGQLVDTFISKFSTFEYTFLPKRKSLVDRVRKCQVNTLQYTYGGNIFDIPDQLRKTKDGYNFLLHYEPESCENRILIFLNSKYNALLRESENFLMDGTFYSAPANFYQIYTIFTSYNANNYIPLVYVMLTNKTMFTYIKLFNILQQKGVKMKSVVMDNEKAVIGALKLVYPSVVINLCFFHFNQNIYKRIQKMGLAFDYYNDLMFKYQIKRFISLTFIENNKIPDFFDQWKKDVFTNKNSDKYKELIFWLENNFITNQSYKLYPNKFRILNKIPLTSNFAESFFRHLNQNVYSANSNLKTIIKTLLHLDEFVDFKLSKVDVLKEISDYWLSFKYKNLVEIIRAVKNEKNYVILDKITECYLWNNDDKFLDDLVQNK